MSKEKLDKIEKSIGIVMRIGVCIAALVMIIGVVASVINPNAPYFENKITFYWLFSELAQFNPFAIMSLGILLLILTPVLRVFASIVLFVYEKDKLYATITSIVLIVLLISFAVGIFI